MNSIKTYIIAAFGKTYNVKARDNNQAYEIAQAMFGHRQFDIIGYIPL